MNYLRRNAWDYLGVVLFILAAMLVSWLIMWAIIAALEDLYHWFTGLPTDLRIACIVIPSFIGLGVFGYRSLTRIENDEREHTTALALSNHQELARATRYFNNTLWTAFEADIYLKKLKRSLKETEAWQDGWKEWTAEHIDRLEALIPIIQEAEKKNKLESEQRQKDALNEAVWRWQDTWAATAQRQVNKSLPVPDYMMPEPPSPPPPPPKRKSPLQEEADRLKKLERLKKKHPEVADKLEHFVRRSSRKDI